MRERPVAWRRIHTLPLPGDEADTLRAEIARAIRRDNRLTYAELLAALCVRTQRTYGIDFCFADECPFCGVTDGWLRMEAMQRHPHMGLAKDNRI